MVDIPWCNSYWVAGLDSDIKILEGSLKMLSREKISTKKYSSEDKVGDSWFLVAILLPEIGFLAGLYFALKGKKKLGLLYF